MTTHSSRPNQRKIFSMNIYGYTLYMVRMLNNIILLPLNDWIYILSVLYSICNGGYMNITECHFLKIEEEIILVETRVDK